MLIRKLLSKKRLSRKDGIKLMEKNESFVDVIIKVIEEYVDVIIKVIEEDEDEEEEFISK